MEHPAIEFMKRAHAGQVRKFSGEPYWTHPYAVAKCLRRFTQDRDTICAGYLHDVPEDTDVTIQQVQSEFGSEVARIVDGVTKIVLPEETSREEKFWLNTQRLVDFNCEKIHTLKLADIWHNCRDLVEKDQDTAVEYLPEKYILAGLLRAGSLPLRTYAIETIETQHEQLTKENRVKFEARFQLLLHSEYRRK